MFEQVVANLLNRVLGDFVENLATDQLNIGIWNGDVQLRNLRLRRDALDKLDLPITVVQGYVGDLVVKIPWQNLKGKPFRINVSNVFLVATPRDAVAVDPLEEIERQFRQKMELLLQAETFHATFAAAAAEQDPQQASYTSQLINKIIDNMQISIDTIHVRYQDALAVPGRPFSLGVTLRELSIVSVNADWQPAFIETEEPLTRKLLNLKSLCVYWLENGSAHDDAAFLKNAEAAESLDALRKLIPTEHDMCIDSFLLKPVSGIGKLTLNRQYGQNVPKYDVTLEFNEFALALSEAQHRGMWLVLDRFQLFNKTIKYRPLRPAAADRSPRALLLFALRAVHMDVRERLAPFTWEYLAERRKDRLDYIRLSKQRKLLPADAELPQDDISRLDELQRKLKLEDLILFNKMVLKHLRDDALKEQKKLNEKKEKEASAPPSPTKATAAASGGGGWFSSWWSSAPASTSTSELPGGMPASDGEADPNVLQFADLKRFLDYDESLVATESTLPPDCILFRVQFKLQTGCIFLQGAQGGVPVFDPAHPIIPSTLSVVFQDMSTQVISCLDSSISALVTMGNLSVYDGLSGCNREVVSPPVHSDATRPLFALRFKSKAEDTSIQIDTQSLTILYTPQTVDAVTHFFAVPDTVADAYLEVAASVKHQTRAGLEYALEQHKATSITVNIDAPVFLVPLGDHEVLAFDSGNLKIQSKLVDTSEKAELQKKEGMQLTDTELEHLLSLMYDKYDVSLTNVKLLVAPTIDQCVLDLAAEHSVPGQIIQGLDVNLLLESSILPKATNLPRLKLSGAMPALKFVLSDRKYKSIMRAVDLISGPPAAAPAPAVSSTTALDTDGALAASSSSASPAGTTPTQDLIDFQFRVGTVLARLLIYDDALGRERELATLELKNFDLGFKQRALEREANIRLETIHVVDLQQPNPTLASLIESSDMALASSVGANAAAHRELVSIQYHQCDPASPRFDGFETTVDVTFDGIHGVVTKKSFIDIYDFLMVTFVGEVEAAPLPPPGSGSSPTSPTDSLPAAPPAANDNKMLVRANMRGIALDLNDGGTVFAKADLGFTEVKVVMGGPSMTVSGTLGALAVTIANGERIAYIEGERSATFQFDSGAPGAADGFDSKVEFSSESTRVLYRPTEINHILAYLSDFASMRNMADIARRRAAETAADARFGFVVHIKSPLIEYRDETGQGVLVYLGQLDARNFYETPTSASYIINASLTDMNIVTELLQPAGSSGESMIPSGLEAPGSAVSASAYRSSLLRQNVLNKVQMLFAMQDTEIKVDFSEVDTRITHDQYAFLWTVYCALFPAAPAPESSPSSAAAVAQPQSSPAVAAAIADVDATAITTEISVSLSRLRLELLRTPTASLTRVDVYGMFFKMAMQRSGSWTGEFGVSRFSVMDSRRSEHVYNDIIALPPALERPFAYQLLCRITPDPGNGMLVCVTLDSPQVLAIFDYIQEVQEFFVLEEPESDEGDAAADDDQSLARGNSAEEELYPVGVSSGSVVGTPLDQTAASLPGTPLAASFADGGGSEVGSPQSLRRSALIAPGAAGISTSAARRSSSALPAPSTPAAPPAPAIRYSINIVNAQVAFVHDSKDVHSSALVLGFQHLKLSYERDVTMRLGGLGVFLCRMDNRSEQVRVLQDFGLSITPEGGAPSNRRNFEVDVDSILLRLSYQEALFIQTMVTQYMNYFFAAPPTIDVGAADANGFDVTMVRSASRVSNASSSSRASRAPITKAQLIANSETARVNVANIRVILVDDLDDLHVPMVDFVLGGFTIDVRDWSTTLRASTSLAFHLNLWNPRITDWEPVVEHSMVQVNLKSGEATKLEVRSDRLINLNVSRHLLETALQTAANWPKSFNILHLRVQKPYLIRNMCGHHVTVWNSSITGANADPTEIPAGGELAWRFEHWHAMRNSTEPIRHRLALHLCGNPTWETLPAINVDRETSTVLPLRPTIDGNLYRLCIDVKVKNKIKVVTIKSPLSFVNSMLVDLDILHEDKQTTLKPGDEYSVPVGAIFAGTVRLRPGVGHGFSWSRPVSWREFLKAKRLWVRCKALEGEQTFHLVLAAEYDAKAMEHHPYPQMAIKVHCPIEFENLLPVTAQYQFVTKRGQQPLFGESLESGNVVSIGTLDVAKALGLLLKVPELRLQSKRPGVIMALEEVDDDEDLEIIDCGEHQKLHLRIRTLVKGGWSRRLSLYSPMVLVNRLPMDLMLLDREAIVIPSGGIHLASEKRLALSLAGTETTPPINLEQLNATSGIVLNTVDRTRSWHVGISVTEGGADRFAVSKVIAFSPRYVVKNMTGRPLQWKQAMTPEIGECPDGAEMPVQWLHRNMHKLIVFRFANGAAGPAQHDWSAPLRMHEVGQVFARMDPLETASGSPSAPAPLLLEVDIVLHEATLFMFVKQSDRWPYRIENLTNYTVHFTQSGVASRKRYTVPAGRSANYALDDPTASDRAIALAVEGASGDRKRNVNLFEVGAMVPWEISIGNRRRVFAMDLMIDGTTRVLQITHYNPKKSIYRRNERRGSTASVSSNTSSAGNLAFEVIDVHSIVNFAIQINVHLGVSLIDGTQELLYLSFSDLCLKYNDTNLYYTYGADVHWIQIDNQLSKALEPIVLFPTELSRDSKEHQAIKLALVKSKDQSHGIQYYKYCAFLLQEMSVSIDQELINAIARFLTLDDGTRHEVTWSSKLAPTPPVTQDYANLMYFEAFQIHPIKLNLTFSFNDTGGVNFFSFFTKIIGAGLGNVHNFPLAFNALTLEHPIVSTALLSDAIYTHYYDQVFSKMFAILGSADFLGNPVGLFNNLASGVQDIFYEPYQGIVSDSPADLGIGLAKGTATFVGKAVYGVADGFAKFTGAVGKGLAMATLDESFQTARQMSRIRNRPRHALFGVTTGAKSLAKGVVSGVTGVITKPIEGAEKEGFGGFFKGVGKGLIGLAAKPVVGLFDMASNISEGVKNTTTVLDDSAEIDRVRLPRFIGEDGVLRPFSEREALGQYWLHQTDNGEHAGLHYVRHFETKKEDYVCIVSTTVIIMVRLRKLRSEWDMRMSEIRGVDSRLMAQVVEGYSTMYSFRIFHTNPSIDFRAVESPDPVAIETFRQQVVAIINNYLAENKPVE
ncbi:Vacuolar protein sorting-associated protein 13 [Blastocladiella emersonii ATCC 22665]|nr:Vacuolar protein sorting-associated protein 13 [Blastocladiella emersonii ATCC 22665]